MGRRHKHEEHANHEAWAIPYGDLITLLLAFFVVMYAMSSVNEGKYRVLSDSLVAAFQGAPKAMDPIQVGEQQPRASADTQIMMQQAKQMLQPAPIQLTEAVRTSPVEPDAMTDSEAAHALALQRQETMRALESVAQDVETAMADLIKDNLVIVRRHGMWVEVELRTDILFPSGVARLSPDSAAILRRLADTLKPFPNPIRVEGHTDNRPINTREFKSNWELSAARAATVVHLLMEGGVNPARLAVIGLGEYRPSQANDTPEGRNANRRVLLVILGADKAPEGDPADAVTAAPPADVPPAEPAPATQAPVATVTAR